MNAHEIGKKLVALCNEGKHDEVVDTLYADDIVSVEAMATPGMDRIANGIQAVRKKGEWWEREHEIHSTSAEGPFPHGDDRFAAVFRFDVTQKATGQRFKMEEVALYTIANDKIVKEEFFYAPE